MEQKNTSVVKWLDKKRVPLQSSHLTYVAI